MKKIITLLFVFVIILSFCSCGGGGNTKLTVDNYSKYFTIGTSGSTTGYLNSTSNHAYYGYEGLKVNCWVSPISDKFIYNDVVFTVKLKGYYNYFDKDASYEAHKEKYIDDPQNFETTVTIDVDISGDGSASQEYSMPEGKLIIDFSHLSDLQKDYFLCEYEVVSVSGSVEKA